MATIVNKIGDSISWKVRYLQSDNSTPVDLTGFVIDVDAYHKVTKELLFNIDTLSSTSSRYITTDLVSLGEFTIVIKDTEGFPLGDYLVDIEYTDVEGFKRSSKSFGLKVVERL
jgi:hypothetical protein